MVSWKLAVVAALCLLGASLRGVVGQDCNTCMANMAYCVSETTYHICPDGVNPSMTTLHSCDEGELCTDDEQICVPSSVVDAATSPAITVPCTDSCGVCPSETTKKMTCVSATQFALCPSLSIVSSCETDQICSMDSYMAGGAICVPQCVADYFEYKQTCSNDIYTTTTTTSTQAPTAEPDPVSLQEQCVQAAVDNGAEGFFYIANGDDPDCKTYLYCEKVENEMIYVRFVCNDGFYDADANKCVEEKPASCSS